MLNSKREMMDSMNKYLNLTEETVRELPAIISYINQKGYNLVTLNEIVSEERNMEK